MRRLLHLTWMITIVFTLFNWPLKPNVINNVASSQRRRTQTPSRKLQTKADMRQVNFESYSFPNKPGTKKFKVEKVVYGDLTGDGQEEAAIAGFYSETDPASHVYYMFGFIYTLRDGQPKMLAKFSLIPDHPDGSTKDVNLQDLIIEDGVLIVSSSYVWDSSSVIKVSYKWDGSKMIRITNR